VSLKDHNLVFEAKDWIETGRGYQIAHGCGLGRLRFNPQSGHTFDPRICLEIITYEHDGNYLSQD